MTNPLYDALFAPHDGSDRVFLHLVGGKTLTYGNFVSMAHRFAARLEEIGLEPGDRVAVQVPKSAEALAVYAACVQRGLVFLPLNTGYTADELTYFLSDSGARLFIGDQEKEMALSALASCCGAAFETLDVAGGGSLCDRAAGLEPCRKIAPRAPDDLAALLYTSGTTGRSKGAMLTQANLLSNAETLTGHWRFTADDVLLHALPIFHTHGLFVATNIILNTGGAMIFMPKFDLEAVIARLPEATAMMGVPTFYTRLLGDPRLSRSLTSHMRLFISGSAPLLAETHREFEDRTGHRILERYGMTETNMNTSNPYDGERRAGTVGFPLPGIELKVTDPATGEEVPTGEVGQIEVRGPNVFKGYWQMPEKTAEELRASGFFITGDLGLIDERGYLQIVGRGKDLIISGGYNIYPKEIELLLDEQPGVLESAVIGIAHPDFGESPVGVLVPAPGAALDLGEISSQIGTSLARFKQPKRLVVAEELPRNAMGKVQKNILREAYSAIFSS